MNSQIEDLIASVPPTNRHSWTFAEKLAIALAVLNLADDDVAPVVVLLADKLGIKRSKVAAQATQLRAIDADSSFALSADADQRRAVTTALLVRELNR